MTGEWGWGERQLILLDSRSQWKVRQVTAERQALVNEPQLQLPLSVDVRPQPP
ncbi:hypothetical protein [Pseudomonas sp. OHS18]|uniref:hypothetical protein n=1 Tax=Pseudomonas sp. OHS18 TaxID=3399679 RepID=UPI003A8A932F